MAIRKNTVLVNDGGRTGNMATATVANAAKAATTAAAKASPATKLSTATVSVTPPKTNTVTSPTPQQTAPNRVTTAVPNVAVQAPQQRAQNIVQNQKQTLGAANRNKIQQDYQKRLSTWSEQNEQEWKQARQEARNAISQEKGRTYHVGIDLNPQQERSDKVNQAVRNYQEINARRDTSSPNATTQIASDDPTKNPISYAADYVTGGVESGVAGVGRFLEDTKYSMDRTKKEDNLYRQGWSREAVNNFLKQDDTKRQQNRGSNALEADAQRRMGAYQVKEGSVAQTLGNAAQGVGNTIPSMLSNLVVPGSGMATLFMSAAGNSAKEALDSGADFNKAYAYGVLSGITEVATEKMFGGIPALGQGYESIEKAIEAAINRSAGNEVERAILRYITDAAGEATEEYLSEVVGAYTRMLWDAEAREKGVFAALDPEVQKQAGEAALSGALSGGFMNIISFTPSGRYSADVEAFADALVDSGVLDESAVRSRNGNIKNEIYNLYDAGIGNTNINRALDALDEGAGPEIMQDLFTGIKQTAETRKAHLAEVQANNKAVVETLPQAARANVEAALDVAKDLGVTVALDPSLGIDNGMMDPTTGDITLNPLTRQPVFAVLVHELSHRNEGTKAYNDLLKAVQSDFDNRLRVSGSRFRSVGEYANFLLANNYRESEIPSELVSNYAQEYLFTDPQAIKQFVKASRSKASRIWKALKQAITKVKDPALINAEYLYSQALGEATAASDAGYWDTLALERNPAYSRGRSELRRGNDGNTSSVSENGLGDGGVLQEASETDLEGGRLTSDENLRGEMSQSRDVLERNLRRVNDVLKNANDLAKKAGAPDVQLRTTDASTFANALAAQMTDDNPYKNHLSWHSAEQFANAGAQMFLTKDGKTGVAVWPDGDITSVFNSNKSKGGSSANLMLTAISMGGNQLDCTGDALLQKYIMYGFIPTGKIAFKDEEASPDWDYAKFGRPDIYFFVHNGQSAEEVANNIGNYPEIRGEDVPYFPDWDAADDYRQAVKNGEQPMPKYSKGGTGLFDDYMSQYDYYSPDYNKGLEDWLSEDLEDDEDIPEAPDFAEYDDAQLNNAYEEALEEDDEWTMEDIVAEAANRAMPNSVVRDAAGRLMPVYHGTDMFGWTEIDLSALDDGRSIFLVDNPTTASTYSGATDESRTISSRVDIPNFKKMSDKQLQEFIDEQMDGIYYAPTEADKAEAIEQEVMLVNLDAQNALDILNDLADGIPDNAFKAYYEALEPLQYGHQYGEAIDAQTLEKLVSQLKKVMLRYPQYTEMIREGAQEMTGSDPFKTFEDTVRIVGNIRDAQFTDGNSFWTKDNMAQFLRTEYEWGQKGNYKVYANLVNPLIIDGEGRWWNDLMDTLPEAIDYSGTWDNNTKTYSKNGQLTTRGVSAYAYDHGYDGVIFRDIVDEGGYAQFKSKGPATVYIAFDPNAVKSADAVTYDDDGKVIPLSERFNTERNELRYSRGGTGLNDSDVTEEMSPAPYASTFYSRLQREVENFKGNKIGASSVISYLKGKGVKDEEIKWSGINTFLEGKKSVGKDELLDYLRANSLEITRETLSSKGAYELVDEETGEVVNAASENDIYSALTEWASDAINAGEFREIGNLDADSVEVVDGDYDEFSGYQQYDIFADIYDDDGNYLERALISVFRANRDNAPRWSQYATVGGENYREYKYKLPGSDYHNRAMDTHWGDRGVLAHARVQDFKSSAGEKVLFIDEIQSDWHNEGSKIGYFEKGADPKAYVERERQAILEELDKSPSLRIIAEELVKRNVTDSYKHAQNYMLTSDPFERHDEKLMNILTDEKFSAAAEDYLQWNEKVQQYIKDNSRLSWGEPLGIPDAPFRKNYTDYVLKSLLREAAENGYNYLAWTTGKMQEQRWSSQYSEGYRIEYDQDIPKFLNKYGKQWGAKVESLEIGDGKGVSSMTDEELVDRYNYLLGENRYETFADDSWMPLYQKNTLLSSMEAEIKNVAAATVLYLEGAGIHAPGSKAFFRDIYRGEGAENFVSPLDLDLDVDDIQTYVIDANANGYTDTDPDKFFAMYSVYPAIKNAIAYNPDGNIYSTRTWLTRKGAEAEVSGREKHYVVPSIPITPQMKQSVLYEGQPLFSRGGTGLRENVSKVASNTYTRTDYIDDINKALMGLDDEDSPYTYNVKSEAQSLANAQARIDADLEGEMQTLPNQEVFDGEDTDTAMMIMHEMFEQGNVDEALRWAKIIQEKGTEAGQRIQAFAKYTRTPEGFIVKGERAIDNALNEWAEKHPREVELIKQLADHLTEWYPSFTADITTEEGFQAVADYIRALAKEYNVTLEQTEAEWIANLLNEKRRAKEIEKAFERLQAGLGTDLTGEEVDEIFQYIEEAKQYPSTSKEAAELHAKAAAVIAKHLNSSFTDKWNAWRYLAMLGNTRTHIRNMLGNILFGTVVDIKNALAGQLEAATGLFTDIDRTKTANIAYLLTPEGQALYKAAKQDGNDIYTVLSGESKYNINREIEGQKQIFDFAPLEALRKFNGDMLEKEDWWALQGDYAKYLSNYMYANGLSPEILQDPNNAQARKARVYAVQEAQKATFRNVNEFAKRYTEFSNGLNNSNNLAVRAIGTMAEGLLPFKNTPANILARGAEYSPLGLLDAVGKGVEMVARGTVSADEFIDSLSSGLTGTGIMVLGYMLASMGLVTGGDDDDEKLQKLKDAEGWQPYSLHVGDKYYTLDWVAPAAIPLFVGANLQALGEMQGADFNDFLTSLSTMAEPLTEMTMMQGVNNILESISYGENKLVDTAFTMGTNYVTQAVPTALGQVARAVDETRRTSTTDNDGFLGDLEYTWRKARSKIPFLSRENEPYLDVWGREQENAGGNVAGRLAYNMLSPGYYSQENVAGVDMLIEDLYAATGEAKYLPSSPSRSLNINGEKTRLSAEDYTTYAKAKGRTARGLIEDYIAQGGELEWDTVGEAVELAYKISNAYGKAMVGADLTEEEASYLDLISAGADPVEILNMGKLSKKQRELFTEGLERGYTLEQMKTAYDAGFGGTKVVVTDSLDPEMYYALMDAGASPEAIAAVDTNGNATWTQQEIFESALSEEEKRLIWEMMGYKTSYDTYARKH